MSRQVCRANPDCIHAKGIRCMALTRLDPNCQEAGECPFFLTRLGLECSESKARSRCKKLGIKFISRKEAIENSESMSQYNMEKYKLRKARGEKDG